MLFELCADCNTEAEFLDEIQTKVLKVLLLAIHCHFYSFALRFIFFKLTQPLTVSTIHLLYTLKKKGGKTDENHTPLPYGLRNPYRNLKSELELSRLCPETSKKVCAHEFGFRTHAEGRDLQAMPFVLRSLQLRWESCALFSTT
jgi:hypothetical protein